MTPRLLSAVLPCVLIFATGCTRPTFPVYADGVREFAYVANSAGNTVTILDLVYLRPDRTIPVGIDPVAVGVNPVRNEVYVVNAQPGQNAGSVSVIDTVKNAVVATIPVHRDPTAITVDSTGQWAFVVNTGSNSVSVLDLEKHNSLVTIATGDKPSAAILSPDARTLVVPNRGSGSVSIYSVSIPVQQSKTNHTTFSLTLRSTFTGCPGAADAVILPDSTKTFVACSAANQVMSIWLAAAHDSWSAKLDSSLTADHVLATLDVGRNPANLILKPDGGEVFASNRDSDSISEIYSPTNEVGSTYAIGNRPAHGVVSADSSALWVSNLDAQTISLYSIADGKFISSIRTGMSPDALAFSTGEQMLLAADTESGDVAVIRTTNKLGPALFTILPAGGRPSAIAVKEMGATP